MFDADYLRRFEELSRWAVHEMMTRSRAAAGDEQDELLTKAEEFNQMVLTLRPWIVFADGDSTRIVQISPSEGEEVGLGTPTAHDAVAFLVLDVLYGGSPASLGDRAQLMLRCERERLLFLMSVNYPFSEKQSPRLKTLRQIAIAAHVTPNTLSSNEAFMASLGPPAVAGAGRRPHYFTADAAVRALREHYSHATIPADF